MAAVTGELKSKVDKLWDTMWTGGDSNPISILEQMTYMMFIHDLDEKDIVESISKKALGKEHISIFDGEFTSPDGRVWKKEKFRWSNLRNVGGVEMFDTISNGVFPYLRSMNETEGNSYGAYLSDARFGFPNEIILQQVFDQITSLYETMESIGLKDIRGDVYEYMLSKMATSKVNGQFRTPRHIIRMMVELMQPKVDEVICDPACGTAGFLIAIAEYVFNEHRGELLMKDYNMDHFSNSMFTGFDKDHTMLRISAMNMMLHNVNAPHIENMDSLSNKNEISDEFSLILANPPFKGSLNKSLVSSDLLAVTDTTKTELLFIAVILRMLRKGGRCAVIVPDGVLFGSSNAHRNVRKKLVDGNTLEAVISMPSGVFKPYAGVSTAILVFTKTENGGTENVWFYDMTADGYSLDDKRTEIPENDIPDIISRFRNLEEEKKRERTEKSFMVSVDEIVSNDYDLSINKYKKTVYEEVKYRPSKEIVDEIDNLNKELADDIKKMKEMLE